MRWRYLTTCWLFGGELQVFQYFECSRSLKCWKEEFEKTVDCDSERRGNGDVISIGVVLLQTDLNLRARLRIKAMILYRDSATTLR